MQEVKLFSKEDTIAMYSKGAKYSIEADNIKRKFLNCPYGEDPRQAVDIYLPAEGGGPFPVIFFLHGGAWMSGDKSDSQVLPFIGAIKRGYAVLSVGYRLLPNIHYPENLFDVKAALRWTAENADTYLLDVSRCALTGASAGAHLAMMTAFTQGQAVFEGAPLSKTCNILAVVDQFGPTDFSKMDSHYDESGYPRVADPNLDEPTPVDMMMGARIKDVPNLLRFINPIDNVHPNVPYLLAQHGRMDPAVPYQQSVEIVDKINSIAGEGHAQLYLSETCLHADPDFALPDSTDCIFGFLDPILKP